MHYFILYIIAGLLITALWFIITGCGRDELSTTIAFCSIVITASLLAPITLALVIVEIRTNMKRRRELCQ